MRTCTPPLLLLIILCLFSTACSDEAASPASTTKPTIGVLIYNKSDVYISLVREAIEQALEGKALLHIQYAEEDQITQNEQIKNLLEQKVSALLVNLVDPQTASVSLNEAQKHKVPIIFFNREPDLDIVKKYPKAMFVGSDTTEAGKLQGDIIAQLWAKNPGYDRNNDGMFQYIMLQGNSDSPEAIARTEYSVRHAKQAGLRMRQVGETYVCNWDRRQGAQAMQLAMATYGDSIEIVISNNDSMALGAIDVLAQHGFNTGDPQKFIPVLGVDAIPEAATAIQRGSMSATIKQDGQAMGKAIAVLALNALAQKDYLDGTPYTWDASGIAVRIPYAPFVP